MMQDGAFFAMRRRAGPRFTRRPSPSTFRDCCASGARSASIFSYAMMMLEFWRNAAF